MCDKYSAMTVNERLVVSGKIDDFDRAVKEENTNEVVFLLREVGLSDESIQPILEKLSLPID